MQICMKTFFLQLYRYQWQPQGEEKQKNKYAEQINVWKSSNLLHRNKQRIHFDGTIDAGNRRILWC